MESILSPDILLSCLEKPHLFILEIKTRFCLAFGSYLRYMFAVSEIPSSLKLQLCRSVIHHRQQCGKQRGKAALAQRRPPCILVKGASAELRRRWMCARYLLVNNVTDPERWQSVLIGGKQMQQEQREAPWLPLQLCSTGRWMLVCYLSAFKCDASKSFGTL